MIERVRNILKAEADAISAIPLGAAVEQAVQALLSCKGKVFTTGIGKAGYVAKKAASTFSTTGTPVRLYTSRRCTARRYRGCSGWRCLNWIFKQR
jgi:D-arabinose 5-phosphate isomerase GutQ